MKLAENEAENVGEMQAAKVYIDQQQVLHWPVMLVYPEHQQTDFIQDFNEQTCLADHFEVF